MSILTHDAAVTRLLSTPTGAAMLAQAERQEREQRHARRTDLAAQRDALEARLLAEIPALDAAIADARENAVAARESAKAAEQRLAGAVAARRSAVYRIERQRNQLEHELRATAAPGIEEFARSTMTAYDELRSAPLTTWSEGGGYCALTDSFRPGQEHSNGADVSRALETLVALRDEARGLVLEPIPDDEINTRRTKLQARLERAVALKQPTVKA